MKRVDRNVFKWFGHVERMGKDRIGKKVIRVCMEENRRRERPQRSWRVEVRELLMARECDGGQGHSRRVGVHV